MRATVNIDDDLLAELKRRAAEERVTVSALVNQLLMLALRPAYRQASAAMGAPQFDLTKALSLAASLEDEETIRKLSRRNR